MSFALKTCWVIATVVWCGIVIASAIDTAGLVSLLRLAHAGVPVWLTLTVSAFGPPLVVYAIAYYGGLALTGQLDDHGHATARRRDLHSR